MNVLKSSDARLGVGENVVANCAGPKRGERERRTWTKGRESGNDGERAGTRRVCREEG